MSGRRFQQYLVIPDRSALLVTARSNVGPIQFGVPDLSGSIGVVEEDGEPSFDAETTAQVSVRVDELSSGNQVYDAELWRRIDARRYPVATVELAGAPEPNGPGTLHVAGDVTFHGVRRLVNGTVGAEFTDGRLVIEGRHVFDIRNFEVATPSLLMLKVYPDVTLELHIEAQVQP